MAPSPAETLRRAESVHGQPEALRMIYVRSRARNQIQRLGNVVLPGLLAAGWWFPAAEFNLSVTDARGLQKNYGPHQLLLTQSQLLRSGGTIY